MVKVMGDGVNNIRVLSLVMYIVLVAHVSGCIFYFIGGIEIDYGISGSWIYLNDNDVVTEPFGESYSKALYCKSYCRRLPSHCISLRYFSGGLTTLMSGESQMVCYVPYAWLYTIAARSIELKL